MSDIFGSVFGAPSKQSQSSQNSSLSTQSSSSASNNQAYPFLSQSLSPQVNTGTQANGSLAAMLGLGGDQAAQDKAFGNFRNSTGYQFGMDQGTNAITGSAAAKGLLNSGSTAKALTSFGQNYANSQYQNYTNLLNGLNTTGNQAGSVISGAGQQSASQSQGQSVSQGTSNGSSTGAKQGIGGFLGSLLVGG